MILLVDIGNTRIKWLGRHAGQSVQRGHFVHRGADFMALLDPVWSALKRPERVIIANVAGADMRAAVDGWIRRVWQLEAWFVAPDVSGWGVRNSYAVPAQMGVDRWVGMIGAHALVADACCIVDCGTATTVDALTAAGEHLGGVIFPGMRLMREALFRNTRQIPAADAGQTDVFGKCTRDCVWGGTAHAVAAAVDGITARMAEAMPGNVVRLLTGGDAENVLPYLHSHYRLEPDLIFHGLLVMAGRV